MMSLMITINRLRFKERDRNKRFQVPKVWSLLNSLTHLMSLLLYESKHTTKTQNQVTYVNPNKPALPIVCGIIVSKWRCGRSKYNTIK